MIVYARGRSEIGNLGQAMSNIGRAMGVTNMMATYTGPRTPGVVLQLAGVTGFFSPSGAFLYQNPDGTKSCAGCQQDELDKWWSGQIGPDSYAGAPAAATTVLAAAPATPASTSALGLSSAATAAPAVAPPAPAISWGKVLVGGGLALGVVLLLRR